MIFFFSFSGNVLKHWSTSEKGVLSILHACNWLCLYVSPYIQTKLRKWLEWMGHRENFWEHFNVFLKHKRNLWRLVWCMHISISTNLYYKYMCSGANAPNSETHTNAISCILWITHRKYIRICINSHILQHRIHLLYLITQRHKPTCIRVCVH